MNVPVRWINAFLDTPASQGEQLARFWSSVSGHAVSATPRGEHGELVPLEPVDADPHLWLQEVDDAPRVHLDLYVAGLDQAVAEATALGATVTSRPRDGLVVLTSPGGLPFCLVAHAGESRRAAPAPWPEGASAVDQICIDVARDRYDAEAAFWRELTGWPVQPRITSMVFERLVSPDELPMHLLLQRLDEESGPTRAHLDVAAADRDAEVRRHEGLGAEVVRRTEDWTVLRDPAGREYCVVDRDPADWVRRSARLA
ncbi:VOC family protein [Rhodococcus sp. X156]|uniref:VOC family protein n=1 Tax=Rhodococcus sp. X156 TaxID=2499145 RepID=UPI000FD8DFC7|nr:VOC family protein [Rhodococcus sp. X156]